MGSGAPPYGVVVVEDDPVVRSVISAIVASSDRLTLLNQIDTVEGAMTVLTDRPDILILDLGLPDGSGIDVIRAVRADPTLQGLKILVLTLFSDEERVMTALSAGADGYLLKDTEDAALLEKIFETLHGGSPISSAAAAHLLRRMRAGLAGPEADARQAPSVDPAAIPLTVRELELLQMLAKGLSYKETALTLKITPNTVGDHVKNIYRKLNVNSRSEAVFEGLNTGVIRL